MPLLDVSDVLSDPDFQDIFDVVRYAESIDDDGITEEAPGPISGVTGVVQPASERTLQRLPDGTRIAGTIEIWTTFPLTSGTDGQGADDVIYQSATYTVTDVADWSRYGAGYYRAIAQMKDLVPGAY